MPLHLELPSRKDARFLRRVSGCGERVSRSTNLRHAGLARGTLPRACKGAELRRRIER